MRHFMSGMIIYLSVSASGAALPQTAAGESQLCERPMVTGELSRPFQTKTASMLEGLVGRMKMRANILNGQGEVYYGHQSPPLKLSSILASFVALSPRGNKSVVTSATQWWLIDGAKGQIQPLAPPKGLPFDSSSSGALADDGTQMILQRPDAIVLLRLPEMTVESRLPPIELDQSSQRTTAVTEAYAAALGNSELVVIDRRSRHVTRLKLPYVSRNGRFAANGLRLLLDSRQNDGQVVSVF